MAKKKEKPKQGIQPLFTALVYETIDDSVENSRDVLQADIPSIYAEARLGVASYAEIKTELAKLVQSIKERKYQGEIPYFKEWLKENKGRIQVEDLEKLLSKEKGSAAMITEKAVDKAAESEQGTLTARVKARTTGVDKNTLKYWSVGMSNYALLDGSDMNPVFRRNCQCGQEGKHTNKRKLWDQTKTDEKKLLDELLRDKLTTPKELGKELHLSCYHEAALITETNLQNNHERPKTIQNLQEPTTIAFDFANRWDLVLEAFTRRYKFKQNYAEIDNYLFQNDIITPYFKGLMNEGKVNKEVIKKSRHFGDMQKQVIMNLHSMFLKNGFKYKGFANEFVDVANKRKSYSTVGIVYENPSKDTAYHIIYDNTFWMPYIVKKEFLEFETQKKPRKYQISPLNLLFNKARREFICEIDDRTQKLAKVSIKEPKLIAATVQGAKAQYDSYREGFIDRQVN
jgi:hypothetical protein